MKMTIAFVALGVHGKGNVLNNLDKINDFVSEVRKIIADGRRDAYSAVSQAMIWTYWNVGKRIVEQEQKGKTRADYGSMLLKLLSQELTSEFGSGFSARNLRNFRQFYLCFPTLTEIWHTRVPNLAWSHFRELLRVDNPEARNWYLNEAANENWSVRTLERNISTQYYFRLLSSQNKKSVTDEMKKKNVPLKVDPTEFVKNPVVAEFLGLAPNSDFSETHLESAIITHLQKFLLELGKGFAFVARQQHIRTETQDFFIDLVFYNVALKCYVLFELKIGKLAHQDIGQMDMYRRMYDELKRTEGDNPTIGVILCSDLDKSVVKYSILNEGKQLFAAKYLTYLPTEEELTREIERQKQIFAENLEHIDVKRNNSPS